MCFFAKEYIQSHQKPISLNINWSERKQKIVHNTPLPLTVVDLIADYEVDSIQKEFLYFKCWFQQYDYTNTLISTTRCLLIFDSLLSCFMQFLLTASLYGAQEKTDCQSVLYVLCWINYILTTSSVVASCFLSGNRLHSLSILRDSVFIDFNKVHQEQLSTSLTLTANLFKKTTCCDYSLFIYMLAAQAPLNFIVSLQGFLCYPKKEIEEKIFMVTNTLSVGFSLFGLYKHRQRAKQEQYLQPLLTTDSSFNSV